MPVLVFGASGMGFAVANLILARALPEGEYARFTLVLALVNLGAPLAAVGLDVVAVRRPLRFAPALLRQVVVASAVVSLATGLIGAAYRLTAAEVAIVVGASLAGGTGLVAAAEYQRRHRFARSLTLVHAPNLVLMLAAGAVAAAGAEAAWVPMLILAGGFGLTALAGWCPLLREPRTAATDAQLPWREAFSLLGANTSVVVLSQLDRLLIPHLLPLSVLATYGALSAVAGSLFRVLQRGVGYALLPRLRAASSVRERRRLVAREGGAVAAVVLAGSLALWWVTPLVEHWLLKDKYHFPPALVLATILAGLAKIVTGFTRAIATALADEPELGRVNLWGWLSVITAIAAATAGARWGLVGIVYGVGFGWMVRAFSAFAITARHLRHPAGASGGAATT